MRSQGEIEAQVCDGISRFQQEFLGRGPRDIHAHVVGPMVLVRLQGVLTPAERRLVTVSVGDQAPAAGAAVPGHNGHNGHNGHAVGMENGNGRSLLKQVRAHVVAAGRPRLREIIEQATGVALVSVHHDISTLTGEEVIVFSLATPPACRAKRNA